MTINRGDGVRSGKWRAALAISLFLHALVLTAASAFIPGAPAPQNKMQAPFYMEVTLQAVPEPFRQGDKDAALADGGTSLAAGGYNKDETEMASSPMALATTVTPERNRESARRGSGGNTGSGVGTGLGTGVGLGSGSGTGGNGGAGITRGPAVLSGAKPDYPDVARAKGWKGTVKLRIFVNRSGEVKETQIAGSSGFEELDNTAHQAVRTWRFRPALENGAAVAAWVTLPIVFELH